MKSIRRQSFFTDVAGAWFKRESEKRNGLREGIDGRVHAGSQRYKNRDKPASISHTFFFVKLAESLHDSISKCRKISTKQTK